MQLGALLSCMGAFDGSGGSGVGFWVGGCGSGGGLEDSDTSAGGTLCVGPSGISGWGVTLTSAAWRISALATAFGMFSGGAAVLGTDSASAAMLGGGAGWRAMSGVTRASGATLGGDGGSVVLLGGGLALAGELGRGADADPSATLGEDAGAGGWSGTLTAGGGGCTCAWITLPGVSSDITAA